MQKFEASRTQSLMTTDSNEISVYKGELTKGCVIKQIEKLKKAFPKASPGYFEVLKDRFVENHFCDERVIDSVNYVIDTYEGWDKLPNIANFIGYDRKVKLYTYKEVCENYSWDDLGAVDVGLDKPRWAKKEDIERYKLNKWEK